MMILRTLLLRRFRLLNLLVPRLNMTCKNDQTYTHDTETVNFLSKASCAKGEMWWLHVCTQCNKCIQMHPTKNLEISLEQSSLPTSAGS